MNFFIRQGRALLMLTAMVVVVMSAYGQSGKVESVKMPDGKTWMKKNLNIKTENSWCYGDNEAVCKEYGRLYTWAAAKAACQSIGWRLPTNEDWENLIKATGVGNKAGKMLKAKSGWDRNGNGTDDYGFSALPGGSRDIYGYYHEDGSRGYWWTATETENSTSSAYSRDMFVSGDHLGEGSEKKGQAFSVRCLKDD